MPVVMVIQEEMVIMTAIEAIKKDDDDDNNKSDSDGDYYGNIDDVENTHLNTTVYHQSGPSSSSSLLSHQTP